MKRCSSFDALQQKPTKQTVKVNQARSYFPYLKKDTCSRSFIDTKKKRNHLSMCPPSISRIKPTKKRKHKRRHNFAGPNLKCKITREKNANRPTSTISAPAQSRSRRKQRHDSKGTRSANIKHRKLKEKTTAICAYHSFYGLNKSPQQINTRGWSAHLYPTSR